MSAHLDSRKLVARWTAPLVSSARGACNACIAAYDAIAAEPCEATIHRAVAYATLCRHRVHDALHARRLRRPD